MVDKAKLKLPLDTEDVTSWSIPQDMVYEIMRYFPTAIIEDAQERNEECEFCIQELRRFIKESQSEPRMIQYVLTKVSIVVSQYPYEDVYKAYDQLAHEILKEDPNMEYREDARVSLFFSNKFLPSVRQISQALLKDKSEPKDVFLQGKYGDADFLLLFKDIYKFWFGRITNIERVFLWYPENLSKTVSVMHYMMQDEGPLPLDWRYYLAIISVAAYDCEYLYWLLIENYLMAGGDKDWLEGLESKTLPVKLRNINQLCLEIAYKPWILRDGVKLNALLRGSDSWSKPELVEAIFIISFWHALCCPVSALGVLPELDFPRDSQKDFFMKADDQAMEAIRTSPRQRSNVEIIETLKKMQKDEEKAICLPPAEEKKEEEDKQKPESKKRDAKLEEILTDDFDGSFSSKMKLFERFYGQQKVTFNSYSYKEGGISSDDYTWNIHGHSETLNFFPELATKISEAHNYIVNLTLERTAIYYYTQYIHGFSHVGFDYKDVNQLLHKDLKNFIKYAACFPQKLNFSIFNKIPVELKPYEICHIALLVFDAKFHIEVMYGLLGLQKT